MTKKILLGSFVIFACIALLGIPAAFAGDALKVGAYGGYFKDSFDKHIYPEFTKETGIKIESIAEPTGEAWLVQLEQAARAGQAPSDISMMSQTVMLRGQRTQLWTPLPVAMILGSLADGMTPDEIRDGYPQLTDRDIRAALAYAADVIHQDILVPLSA